MFSAARAAVVAGCHRARMVLVVLLQQVRVTLVVLGMERGLLVAAGVALGQQEPRVAQAGLV